MHTTLRTSWIQCDSGRGYQKYFIIVANLPVEEIPAVYENLMRTAMRRTNRDEELSRDLVQQAFVRALKHEYDKTRSSLNTWMHRILHGLIADHRKTQKSRPTSVPINEEIDKCVVASAGLKRVDFEDFISVSSAKVSKKLRVCLNDVLEGTTERVSAKHLRLSRSVIHWRRQALIQRFKSYVED